MPPPGAGLEEPTLTTVIRSLTKRIKIPVTSSSPPGLIAASKQDPWSKSGKYALGWVYFSIILLVLTMGLHWYHYWADKITRATHKEEVEIASSKHTSPDSDFEMHNMPTNNSTRKFFPDPVSRVVEEEEPESEPMLATITPLEKIISLSRYIFYRPIPAFRWKKRELTFPSPGAAFIIFAALAFVTCYCFIPQPLFYTSIDFGSPPLAIRAGMIAVAMMPWIIATSMKANLITFMTGIGPERLGVFHRWAAYICMFLSLVHTIPFYVTPVWEQGALATFKNMFQGFYVYGTGLAALVPLLVLCVHSLPILRRKFYEIFVALHVPISIIYVGMLFWHCHNYLTSWNYLWATVAIWALSYVIRIFFTNWTNPWRMSWLIGEEAALTILPENAVKVTIPTQKKWTPGQYVYLRMPGISVFETHPFTIASLCSDDFPSEYGEQYRDMTLVFRPFGGFTRKTLESAIAKGPEHTYRAFIEGPYGGVRRDLASFDTIVLFAGGSGITAIVSHLLDLIKKMRDGKAVTKNIHVVWALKRPETMEWFREELKICRDHAPPESVHCQFFITAAKRLPPGHLRIPPSPSRPFHDALHKQIDTTFQGIASKRSSALIQDAAQGDPEKEMELRAENEDSVSGLPHPTFLPAPKKAHTRNRPSLTISTNTDHLHPNPPPSQQLQPPTYNQLQYQQNQQQHSSFDFGFPSTPTMFQKSLMRFAFMPSTAATGGIAGLPTIAGGGANGIGNGSKAAKSSGWSTEYGRPDIRYMLRELEREKFGRRTAVFVCGPPSMRVDVQREVAELQRKVFGSSGGDGGESGSGGEEGKGGNVGSKREEIYLHTENYAI